MNKPENKGSSQEILQLLISHMELVAKNKRTIAISMTSVFIVSACICILLPNIYTSTAMILPPQQNEGLLGAMMGQMDGGVSSVASTMLGKGSPADMYAVALKSRDICDPIIMRFKLKEVYDKELMDDAYRTLNKKVDVEAGKKDGIITITVEDRDPKRAAGIANAFVDGLGKLMAHMDTVGAGQDEAFLGKRLAEAKVNLANAEDGLKAFQSKNKMVSVTDQASAAIGGIAQVKAQLAVQEMNLSILQRNYTDSTQEVKNARESVTNLKAQMARLEGQGSGGPIPGFSSVPELGEQYLRLMREFRFQETLVDLLTKQYAVAKLTQARETSPVKTIQQAYVPLKKTRPKRALIVLLSTVTAGFMTVIYAFLREAFANLPESDRKRLANIRHTVFDWSIRGKRGDAGRGSL